MFDFMYDFEPDLNFQTPPHICQRMVEMIPITCQTILEPTPGAGNLVNELKLARMYHVTAPENFADVVGEQYDCIVANPPFSPSAHGYMFLYEFMKMTNEIIILMPWNTLINSDKRTRKLIKWGLRDVVSLPRSVWPGARVQSCIMRLSKGWREATRLEFQRSL